MQEKQKIEYGIMELLELVVYTCMWAMDGKQRIYLEWLYNH